MLHNLKQRAWSKPPLIIGNSLLLIGLLLVSPAATGQQRVPAAAASAANTQERRMPDTQNTGAAVDSAAILFNPNTIPYRSHRSVGHHLLALPSTIWNAFWYPIGEFTIWLEQSHLHERLINLIFGKKRVAGITPIGTVGDNTAVAVGLLAYHNNLFHRGNKARLMFLFASDRYHQAIFHYSDAALLGSPLKYRLDARYLKDSEENYFDQGNDSPRSSKSFYGIKGAWITNQVSAPLTGHLSLRAHAGFKHVEIFLSDEEDEAPIPRDLIGFTSANIGAVGGSLQLDLRRGKPRVISGWLGKVGYEFNSEFSRPLFQFHRYYAEIQKFTPLPFLPENRRLAFRGAMEKLDVPSGKQVPFYELPILGTSSTLRGFAHNRFRATGTLLFNLEYRYPIYDFWDAVIFLDEGQLFDQFSDLRLDGFHWSAGFGVRIMTSSIFLFRMELAFSRERTKVLVKLEPMF